MASRVRVHVQDLPTLVQAPRRHLQPHAQQARNVAQGLHRKGFIIHHYSLLAKITLSFSYLNHVI